MTSFKMLTLKESVCFKFIMFFNTNLAKNNKREREIASNSLRHLVPDKQILHGSFPAETQPSR